MTIYWNKTSIPALKGLSKNEQSTLIRPVLGVVWRRWQVWLPVLVQTVAIFSFMIIMPQFQYRLPIIVVMAYVTVKLAFLPFNHFLALELEKGVFPSKG
ncbi:hypothetical protein [Undibacterium sp. TS12]|uniref:hypothetical protein n=1 Tax=Undibacterium sp. TS12 TaxID=2908202 RepID=UPI001F4D1370|nr:hypothetical protein [Undibacterium sp. TS12]MCH8623094.1 hypothetical protein [Undibacterium sp. TS12]